MSYLNLEMLHICIHKYNVFSNIYSIYIYIYIYIYTHTHTIYNFIHFKVYIYIYIYIYCTHTHTLYLCLLTEVKVGIYSTENFKMEVKISKCRK